VYAKKQTKTWRKVGAAFDVFASAGMKRVFAKFYCA
jgi:hypothetical protein